MNDPQSDTPSAGAHPALHVHKVIVDRMYGIAQPALSVEDLSSGVNIVYGKNAAGKTTLARALQALLWPDSAASYQPTLTGLFKAGGHTYRVDVENGRGRYQRDGQDTGRPPLAPEHTRDRYHLYLQELLRVLEQSGTNGSDHFAEAIRRQAGGGYDVAEAREELDFSAATPRKGKATRDVEEAWKQLKEVQTTQDQLLREQRGLESKNAELKAARQAGSRVEAINLALEWREVRAEFEAAEETLQQFPDVMPSVGGDEEERVTALQEKVVEKERSIKDEKNRLREAKSTIEESFLPEEGLPDGFTEEFSGAITTLEKHINTAEQLSESRAGEMKKSEKLWQQILKKTAGGEQEAEAVDVSSLQRLSEVVETAMPTRAEADALQRYIELLEADFDEARLQAVKEGTRYLRNWLRSAKAEEEEPALGPGFWIVLAVGLVLLTGAVLTAVLAQPAGWPAIGIGIIAVLGVLLLVAGYLIHRKVNSVTAQTRAPIYRKDYEQLSLESPGSWSPDEVSNHLRTLEREQATLILEQRKAEERQRADRTLKDLAEQEEQVKEVQKQAAVTLGFTPDESPELLWWYVERLSRWQDARSEIDTLDGKLARVEDDIATAKERLQDLTAPYKSYEIFDPPRARGIVEELRKEDTEVREAARDKKAAGERLKQLREEVDARKQKITSIYEQLGLEEGDLERLQELCKKQEPYAEAKKQRDKHQVVRDEALRRLKRHAAFEQEMLELTLEDLKLQKQDAKDDASEAEDLADSISKLEQRIETAMKAHDLEAAQSAYRSACDDLAAERERDFRSHAGHLLAQFVEQQTQEQALPKVFKRARSLLLQITGGRYKLLFDVESNAFRAMDTVDERGLALDELSSGTRLQLLLAVRLAFVEKQEEGWKLPIILDEALANSDAERAAAIIEAIKTLAESGRQVFYLTAQETEAAKWERTLGDGHPVDHKLIYLSEKPSAVNPEDVNAHAILPSKSDLPDPDGLTHSAYGERLDLPLWSLRQPVGKVHLWYMMDDVQTLHRLLSAGITLWGQLQALRDEGVRERFGLDERQWKPIEARASILSAWKKAWHVGRGRKVTRSDLEDSGAVSDTFIDEVSRLCQRLDGDGEQLIAAMYDRQVDRFRENKINELKEYLLDNGFINPDPQLTPDEVRTRILNALAAEIRSGVLSTDDIYEPIQRIEERRREAASP